LVVLCFARSQLVGYGLEVECGDTGSSHDTAAMPVLRELCCEAKLPTKEFVRSQKPIEVKMEIEKPRECEASSVKSSRRMGPVHSYGNVGRQ